MSKTGTFHVISGLNRAIFRILFFDRFWRFKKCNRSFFAFFAKILPKTCIAALNHEIVLFNLFYLENWDDLDLYYGHKAQEMLLKNVSDTIPADSLALFALNIEILHADVTKLECQTFWLWPDLWRHWWPRGHENLFSFDSFSRAFKCRLNF